MESNRIRCANNVVPMTAITILKSQPCNSQLVGYLQSFDTCGPTLIHRYCPKVPMSVDAIYRNHWIEKLPIGLQIERVLTVIPSVHKICESRWHFHSYFGIDIR